VAKTPFVGPSAFSPSPRTFGPKVSRPKGLGPKEGTEQSAKYLLQRTYL
jgi:hypothetical protein